MSEMKHLTSLSNLHGLYLVTPDWNDTGRLLSVTERALCGGTSLVQYRHKTASPALRLEQADALLALCRRYDKPLLINDHLDLCQAIDADGLHVGATDLKIAEARAILGQGKIIGASCYGDLALAEAAAAAGASYLAFGGFYPSPTKAYAFRTDPAILDSARQRWALPLVVIGGMTAADCPPLIARGVQMVAVINSVYGADQPQQAAAELTALFSSKTA